MTADLDDPVERINRVLDAWSEERDRAQRLEGRVVELEGRIVRLEDVLSRFLFAVAATSFAPTPELEAVLQELAELFDAAT